MFVLFALFLLFTEMKKTIISLLQLLHWWIFTGGFVASVWSLIRFTPQKDNNIFTASFETTCRNIFFFFGTNFLATVPIRQLPGQFCWSISFEFVRLVILLILSPDSKFAGSQLRAELGDAWMEIDTGPVLAVCGSKWHERRSIVVVILASFLYNGIRHGHVIHLFYIPDYDRQNCSWTGAQKWEICLPLWARRKNRD